MDTVGDNWAAWFAGQIEASTNSLVWGMEQIPAERRSAAPPSRLGDWPAARLAFHIMHYEREVALPSIRHWLGEPYPTFEHYSEASDWDSGVDWDTTRPQLVAVRAGIIEALQSSAPEAWDEVRDTAWGRKSLYWVVSKTYQHGIEHLSGILRLAMLWDHYASREAKVE